MHTETAERKRAGSARPAAPSRQSAFLAAVAAGIVSGTCYPHLALSDGILCCKDRDGRMVVFSVRGKPAASAESPHTK